MRETALQACWNRWMPKEGFNHVERLLAAPLEEWVHRGAGLQAGLQQGFPDGEANAERLHSLGLMLEQFIRNTTCEKALLGKFMEGSLPWEGNHPGGVEECDGSCP